MMLIQSLLYYIPKS